MQLERALAVDLAQHHPADAARVLEDVSTVTTAAVLQDWQSELAAPVLAAMSTHLAGAVVAAMAADAAASLLSSMERATAAHILRRVPEATRVSVLAALPPDAADLLRARLRFPEGTAAAWADADVLCLPADITAAFAMRRVRAAPRLAHHNILVIDEHGTLVGVMGLRDLFIARPRALLSDVMTKDIMRLPATASAHEIVAHPGWRTLSSLPVVDDDRRPIGALRWRKAREIEQALRGASDEGVGEAARALGELFLTGLSGAVDAVTSAGHERERDVAVERGVAVVGGVVGVVGGVVGVGGTGNGGKGEGSGGGGGGRGA